MIKRGCAFLSIILSVLSSAHAANPFKDGFEPLGTAIILPDDNAVLGQNDDADNATGFQVLVSFSTRDPSTSWVLSSQKGCDSSYIICEDPVIKAQGPVTHAGDMEPAALITLSIDGPTTYHRIKLEASDSMGNLSFAETRITVMVPFPACIYGVCDATACGTDGHRYPTNAPCAGAPSLTCSAPACPACSYGSCSATVCGTSGTQTATNLPCTGPTTLDCSAPACPSCAYGACSATECGTSGTQTANNQPCTGDDPKSCEAACPGISSISGLIPVAGSPRPADR
jgi:hypothetical protein